MPTTVVAISDLHGNLPEDLPGGDVLVIGGDVCPIADHEVGFQARWMVDELYPWIEALPHPEVIWIAGNHDPAPPASLLGEAHDEIRVGPITFRHEPRAGDAHGEIAGHLHPVARVVTTRGSLRRRCRIRWCCDGHGRR